ncbi:MAG: hypothetical protein R3F14_31220 [Polyangiaceae bacterium]
MFVLAELAFAGGVTALALWPPRFDGWVSLLGGVLGLGYFLAVQPVGTAVRDALRPPSTAFVRGVWIESASPREGQVSARGGDASTRAAGAPRPSRS